MSGLHDRLHDLAESVPEWDDPLPGVLARATDARTVARARRPLLLPIAAAVVAVLVVAGGVLVARHVSDGSASAASRNAASAGAAAAQQTDELSCGRPVPKQYGPAVAFVHLSVSAPHDVSGGSAIIADITTTVTARRGMMTGRPGLVAVSGGRIVQVSIDDLVYQSRQLPVGTSRGQQVVSTDWCSPPATRSFHVLAFWRYTLDGVPGLLVSAPATVTVR